MNIPIARLFGVIVLLFALLIVWTSRWTVFEAGSLNNNLLNRRTLIDELKIKRGRILADDGNGARPLGPGGGRHLRALLSDRQPVRPARSGTRSPPRAAAPGWSGLAATRCAGCRPA